MSFLGKTAKSASYRNYMLLLLVLVYGLNYADRLAIGIALESIKASLYLSDTELGVLTGVAFAALYALVGIPIARVIDQGDRIKVLALTAAVWSVMVTVTGRAMNFAEILLARIGVGIGDAGSFPVAQSLIPDYFTRAERPHATAVFMLGWPTALFIGFFAAGWLNQIYGWRTMFLMIGAPGMVLALLALLTLKEPRTQGLGMTRQSPVAHRALQLPTAVAASLAESCRGVKTAPEQCPGIKEVLQTLWGNDTYRNLLLCYSVMSFFSSGVFQWQPAFFMRSFGMQSGEVGTWLSMMMGAGSLVSIYAGGAIATRWAAHKERLQFTVISACYVAFGVDHALAYLSPRADVAFALLGVGSLMNAVSGPLFAAIQTLVPSRMRATSYAILLLFSNLVGIGLGPLAAGVLSDALQPLFGQNSLRYALLMLCPGFAWGAWYMWRARSTVTGDLESVGEHDGVCE